MSKDLAIAYAAKRASRKKLNPASKDTTETVDQNFLSDEDEVSERSDETNPLFDNPHESPDDEQDKSGGLLDTIMKKVRRKRLGR